MRGLVGLLQDEADSVNLSAMSALRMLSESRDGCDLLLDAEAIVGFVGCLSEMKRQPILLGEALFSLGNLTKLAESIKQAMAAGAVDRLMALLAEGEEVSGVQMQALVLKCVWNIANLDEGKVAIIEASGTWPRPRPAACRLRASPAPALPGLCVVRVRRGAANCAVPPLGGRGHPPAGGRRLAGLAGGAGGQGSRPRRAPPASAPPPLRPSLRCQCCS